MKKYDVRKNNSKLLLELHQAINREADSGELWQMIEKLYINHFPLKHLVAFLHSIWWTVRDEYDDVLGDIIMDLEQPPYPLKQWMKEVDETHGDKARLTLKRSNEFKNLLQKSSDLLAKKMEEKRIKEDEK